MILFVFEGDNPETSLYETIERLYFPSGGENIICSFGNNIYELYREITELGEDADIVSIMKERLEKRENNSLKGKKSSDFAEIYLFFDYDFHNKQLSIDEINMRIEKMLELFNEETEYGKLYINYPMVESIRYVKELPDENYVNYTVARNDCNDFKKISAKFSSYGSLDFIQLKGKRESEKRLLTVRKNWDYLKTMNVSKANFLVNNTYQMPVNKDDINQAAVFKAQKENYIEPANCVSILSPFPIFIYDYMK